MVKCFLTVVMSKCLDKSKKIMLTGFTRIDCTFLQVGLIAADQYFHSFLLDSYLLPHRRYCKLVPFSLSHELTLSSLTAEDGFVGNLLEN